MSNKPISRRRFIKRTSTAAVGVGTSALMTRNVLGANEKLNIACIGVGGRGGGDVNGVKAEHIVALCDVDSKTLGHSAKSFPKAAKFRDYRKMIDQIHKEIDAVVIATPDHHHAPATLRALAHGKHVYCEKPLTHTVKEARLVGQATARHKVVTQMGTQIHEGANYRRVVELIQTGIVGKVNRVHTWVGGSYHGGDRPKQGTKPPANLDWDLWIGPSPMRPYVPKKYHPFQWRGWWDFGGGVLADMACHHMDLPYWALGLGRPTRIEATGPKPHPDAPGQWNIIDYHYPARTKENAGHFGFLSADHSKNPGGPAVHLTWYHGNKRPPIIKEMGLPNWGGGNLFIGDKGILFADYGKHILYRDGKEVKDFQRPAPWIPNSAGHHREWIQACKAGTTTTCNFDYASTLTEGVLLGNVAFRSGQAIQWDGQAGQITNTRKADEYLAKTYRKGWEINQVI